MSEEAGIIMSVEHITKEFPAAGGKTLRACDDISFHVRKGETVAIGEILFMFKYF